MILACRICESPAQPMYEWHGFKLVRCAGCGHESVASLPTPDQLSEFYQSISGKKMVRSERRLKLVTRAFDRYLEDWRRHTGTDKPERFLDLGGGVGYYTRAAQDRGISACLMDYADDALSFSKVKLNIEWFVCGDIQRCAQHLMPEAFDFVLARHVIEHMLDPEEFVRNVARVMPKGGLLEVETPNVDTCEQLGHPGVMVATMRRIRQDNPNIGLPEAIITALRKAPSGVNPPKHLSGFTKGSLRLLLERSGFEILRVRCAPCGDAKYDPLYYDLHRLRDRRGLGIANYFWERVTSPLFRANGMNLAILARRL